MRLEHCLETRVRKMLMSSTGRRIGLIMSLSGVYVGCVEETARRSAVDPSRLCNNDSNQVFAGSCITRGERVVAGGPSEQRDDDAAGRREAAEAARREAAEAAEREAAARREAEQAAAEREAAARREAEAAAAQREAEAAAARRERAEAAEREAAARREAETEAAARREAAAAASAAAAVPTTPSVGGRSPGATESFVKVTVLTFKQDSFIAIADKVVAGNCFVPAGTKIEFSGDAYEIAQFADLGIRQTIVFGVVKTIFPEKSDADCKLDYKDFLFISGHGAFEKQEAR